LFSLKGHEVVLEAHRKFLEAGADVICTNSYQVSFEAFTHADAFSSLPGGAITKEKFQLRYTNDVLRTSVELAKKARHDSSTFKTDVARLQKNLDAFEADLKEHSMQVQLKLAYILSALDDSSEPQMPPPDAGAGMSMPQQMGAMR